jgi:hypothetical protein
MKVFIHPDEIVILFSERLILFFRDVTFRLKPTANLTLRVKVV